MNRDILSALIGLVGAVNNNGKTKQTDALVREALVSDNDFSIVEKIRCEKYAISPNCEICQSPCGNTSDYPPEKYELWSKEQREIRKRIITEAKRIAINTDEGKDLPDVVYKAIAYVGYDLYKESYTKILEELRKW